MSYFNKYLFIAFILVSSLLILTSPDAGFVKDTTIRISKGDSLSKVAEELKSKSIIRSEDLLKIFVLISGKDEVIVSGEYVFEQPENLFSVIDRITKGKFGVGVINIVLIEGMTNKEMAKVLSSKITNFDTEMFMNEIREGYAFPDTYKFFKNSSTADVVEVINRNFISKIKSIEKEISNSKYNLDQIINMASIIESEATADSRQEISNILWKRYELGMALQVDASFVYILNKGTFDLTKEDLKIDSPYNTYENVGLPPTPIANPGLEAIKASANPEKTPYLYFLTGKDGKMYYGKNFEEHKRNKELYLYK